MDQITSQHQIKICDKLTSDLKNQITDFRQSVTVAAEKRKTQREKIEHDQKYCSQKDIKKWILVFEENKIIGMLAVFQRQIKFQHKNISLGGIGKVQVRDDKRRQGIASKMMSLAIKQLEKLNCDVAYLCTRLDSFLADFYAKYGFIKLGKPYTFLSSIGKRYTENDGMLAPIKSQQIFKQILKDPKPLNLGTGNW
jgi:predicted acetyltransferase